MAAGDLTNKAAVKAYVGIQDTNLDALLDTLVTAASSFFVAYCGRTFASAAFTETRNGNGADRMVCRNTPLTAVASVTVNDLAIPPAPDTRSYGFVFDDAIIYIRQAYQPPARYPSGFCRGVQNVVLAYTGGYVAIPPDLAQACVEAVAWKLAKRNRIDKKSEVIAQQTTSFDLSDLPAGVKSLLDSQYKLTMVAP